MPENPNLLYTFAGIVVIGVFFPQIKVLANKIMSMLGKASSNSGLTDAEQSAQKLARYFATKDDQQGYMLSIAVCKHLLQKELQELEDELTVSKSPVPLNKIEV